MKTYYKTEDGKLIKVTEEEVMMEPETEAARLQEEIDVSQEKLDTLTKCVEEKQAIDIKEIKK